MLPAHCGLLPHTKLLLLLVAALGAACSDSTSTALVASAVVGTDGGVLTGEGMTLQIPPGALGAPTEISVFVSDTELPGNPTLLTPLLRLEPDGLQFETPATVTLTLPEGRSGVVFTTSADRAGYEAIGFAYGGSATVDLSHFSELFGEECTVSAGSCAITDDQGGLACRHKPPDTTVQCYPDTTGLFVGDDGTASQGYARRDLVRNMCFCRTFGNVRYSYGAPADVFLCKRDWDLIDGRWQCSTTWDGNAPERIADDWALRGYPRPVPQDGQPVNGSCDGFMIDYATAGDATTETGNNRHAFGELHGCQVLPYDTEWQQVDCTIYNSQEQAMAALAQQAQAANAQDDMLAETSVAGCASTQLPDDVPSTELPPTEEPPASTEPAP